jgi:hypothetical protein
MIKNSSFILTCLILLFNTYIPYTNSKTIKNIKYIDNNTNIKNSDITLLFTFYNHNNHNNKSHCSKVINRIEYDIKCNNTITLNKCCNHFANIYYPNILKSKHNNNHCLLYNNQSISFKCYNTNNRIILINIVVGLALCFNIILMISIYNCYSNYRVYHYSRL